MKVIASVCLVLISFCVLPTRAGYPGEQDATPPKPDAANGGDAAYSNECLALTYRLPDGWKLAKLTQPGGSHQSNQQMKLFRAQRHSESLEVDVLQTPTLKHPNMERFTILLALSLTHTGPLQYKVTRDAYPVTIAGRSYYRSDLASGNKAMSLLATWYRGYAVVASASADSRDLDDATNALSGLSFGEDKRTAECFGSTN